MSSLRELRMGYSDEEGDVVIYLEESDEIQAFYRPRGSSRLVLVLRLFFRKI